MKKLTAPQLKKLIAETVEETPGGEGLYTPESTPSRGPRDVVWSRMTNFSGEHIKPGDTVEKSKKGSAARHGYRSPVRLYMTPDWGPTRDPKWVEVDPYLDTLTTGENPVMGHLEPGERVKVLSVWKASTKDHTALPYGATKIVELEKEDGTSGFAPAHWFSPAS